MAADTKGTVKSFGGYDSDLSGSSQNYESEKVNDSGHGVFFMLAEKYQQIESRYKLIGLSLLLGLLAVLFDYLFDLLFFSSSSTNIDTAAGREIFNRLMVFFTYSFLGVLISSLFNKYKSTETAFQKINEELEGRVLRRTEKLVKANNKLQLETVERKKAEQQLKYKVEFIDIVAKYAKEFISIDVTHIDRVIEDALMEVGKFEKVDRAYVFLYTNSNRSINNTHEWCEEGIPSQKAQLQNLPIGDLQYFTKMIDEKQLFFVHDVETMDDEYALEKGLLQQQSIQSIIIIPIMLGGENIGYLGFDSCREKRSWDNNSVNLMRIFGEMIVNAIQRRKHYNLLLRSEQKYKSIFYDVPVPLYRVDMEGNIIDANKSLSDMFGYTQDEIVNLNVSDFYGGIEDRTNFIENVLVDDGKINSYKLNLKKKDGTFIPVLDSAKVVKNKDGKALFVEGVMTLIKE